MRICVIGGGLRSALRGIYIGGAEKQNALIASSLARLGHEVTAVDLSHGGGPVEEQGVRVVRAWEAGKGVRILRFFTHRVPSLAKTVAAARPDIVYIRSTDLCFAALVLAGIPPGAKTVWGIAHDQDVDMSRGAVRTRRASLYRKVVDGALLNLSARALLRRADLVLCQTRRQYEIVRSRNKRAAIVPSLFDASEIPRDAGARSTERYCLWIARFCGTKGENELLELARKTLSVKFRAIGRATPDFERAESYRRILRQENIRLLGRMEYAAVLGELRRAPLLVHTAPAEGFSNTFLEAWACGCPVASLAVDPDGLLSAGTDSGGPLGLCARGDSDALRDGVVELIENRDMAAEIGARAREYVARAHSRETVASRIERCFLDLLDER